MTGTTDALVLDLVEWVGARAQALFRSDRDVADLMPAPDDLGRCRRSRLCRAPAATGEGVRVAVTEGGAKFLRDNGR